MPTVSPSTGGRPLTKGKLIRLYYLVDALSNFLFGRHLGGARQDNRIVPFEGVPISKLSPLQREEVYAIVQAFNTYLPEKVLKAKMDRVRKFEDQTYFAWIGKYGLSDPYYFRIHSPVTFCEVHSFFQFTSGYN